MADLRYLHSEALKLRHRAHEKLSGAYQATVKALTFNRASDYSKAIQESELADHFYNEAIQLEHEAMEIDHHVADLELKASELDRQATELNMTIRSKLEILDRLKRAIVGEYLR